MRRRALPLWLAIGVAACRTAAPSASAPASGTRFPNAAEIEIMMDGDSLPRPALFNRGPHYPAKLRNAGITGQLVAAFVIDAAGRVEAPSISFVQPAAHAEFQESVCRFLRDEARFIPGLTDGRPRRTLVFMPFAFTLNFAAPAGFASNVKALQERARAAPRDQLVAELETRPHC